MLLFSQARYGISERHASRRSAGAHAVRRLLQARKLLHRSDPAGRQGRDHAWPFRPCAARPRRGAGHARNARHDAAALRRQFRRHHASGALRRDADAGRRHRDVPSSWPCAWLGAGQGRMQGNADRRFRRLQGQSRSDLRAIRAAAMRRLHHRSHVRPAGVPPRRRRRGNQKAAALGQPIPRARASGRRLFAWQGAARHCAAAAAGLRQADLSARRDGEDYPLLREPRCRLWVRSN